MLESRKAFIQSLSKIVDMIREGYSEFANCFSTCLIMLFCHFIMIHRNWQTTLGIFLAKRFRISDCFILDHPVTHFQFGKTNDRCYCKEFHTFKLTNVVNRTVITCLEVEIYVNEYGDVYRVIKICVPPYRQALTYIFASKQDITLKFYGLANYKVFFWQYRWFFCPSQNCHCQFLFPLSIVIAKCRTIYN